jgi:uncharacterized protein (TIGR02217 family)
MAFFEVQFPVHISYGSSMGPERKTQVFTAINGFEHRNQQWENSIRTYNAGTGVTTEDELAQVVDFFEEVRGMANGFRWKDWGDYKSCIPSLDPSPTDQAIGIGDEVTTEFQLSKIYGGVFNPYTRAITKPVTGTVSVALDSVEQLSGWSVDNTTGIVTFDTAPANGVIVTAGYEFDVPCRFNTDNIEYTLTDFFHGTLNFPVREIRI